MSKTSRCRHGFALITAIGAITLVLMLLGAFFISHHSFLAASRQSDDGRACQEALLALTDFCRYRFEKDKGWTTEPFAVDPEIVEDDLGRPVLTFDQLTQEEFEARPELQNLHGLAHLVGAMESNGVRYHLAVSNSFQGTDPISSDGVERKSCRIRMEARRGTATERVELVLTKSPLVDSTIFASENIEIGGDYVHFNSKDAVRNVVRSLTSVDLPDTDRLRFRSDEAAPPAIRGTVWAQDEDGQSGGTQGSISIGGVSTPEKLQATAAATQAQFFPDDPRRYNPPEIKKSDIRMLGQDLPPKTLAAAHYTFAESPITYTSTETGELVTGSVKSLQRYEPQGPSPGEPGYQNLPPTDVYYLQGALPPTADPDTVVWGAPGGPAPAFTPALHGAVDDGVEVPDGPTVKFRLPDPDADPPERWEPRVELPADTELKVESGVPDEMGTADFRIDSSWEAIPEIAFLRGDGQPGPGLLNADRDISLQGKITGSAQFVAGRDIETLPRDVEVLADARGDVACFAGRDVTIRPLYDPTADPNQGGHFVFRGLVYTGRNFVFSSRGQAAGNVSNYNRTLNIQGALVARGGSVNISGNGLTTLTYDPSYLDRFLEDELLNDKVRLEELSWRRY